MRWLSIEAATPLLGVAAYDAETGLLAFRQEQAPSGSGTLLQLVESTVRDRGWSLRDVQGVVCGAGPGSFTGLRIACATAKSLCFDLGVPLVMASSLQAMQLLPTAKPCLAGIPAIRDQVFVEWIAPPASGQPANREAACLPWSTLFQTYEHIPNVLFLGAAPHPPAGFPTTWSWYTQSPHPAILVQQGARLFRQHGGSDLITASPSYVAPSYVDSASR